MPPDRQPAEVTDGDFTIVSTSTSQADLDAQLAPAPDADADTPAPETPAPESAPESAPEDEAPATTPAAETPAAEKPAGKPTASTPGGRVAQLKAEIATLTHEKHRTRQQKEQDEAALATARAELAEVTRQIAEKRAQLEPKTPEPSPAAARAPEPKEDDFEDFREWVKAHAAWTRDQAKLDAEELVARRDATATAARVETDAQARREQYQAERAELARQHGARVLAHEQKNPGFQALMESAGALPTNPFMDEHILHSEHGPALMQYLAENPEECERISALGLGPTLVELGVIESRFRSAPPASEREPRPRTKAAPPVRAVAGSTSVAADDADEDLSTMPFGPEYVRKMNAREKARRQARL